jgi:23S rRNA G2445 N2-methylase RlmL
VRRDYPAREANEAARRDWLEMTPEQRAYRREWRKMFGEAPARNGVAATVIRVAGDIATAQREELDRIADLFGVPR